MKSNGTLLSLTEQYDVQWEDVMACATCCALSRSTLVTLRREVTRWAWSNSATRTTGNTGYTVLVTLWKCTIDANSTATPRCFRKDDLVSRCKCKQYFNCLKMPSEWSRPHSQLDSGAVLPETPYMGMFSSKLNRHTLYSKIKKNKKNRIRRQSKPIKYSLRIRN